MRARRLVGLMILGVAVPASAAAQEARGTGLVMGYPTSVAVQWHASDRVALRPELRFAFSSADLAATLGETTASQIGGGVSALLFLRNRGPLLTYLVPRFAVTRTRTTLRLAVLGERTTAGNQYEVSGAFGAQYRAGDRFSIFGEAGAEFTRATIGTEADSRRTSWSARTAAGVVLYF